MGRVQNNIVLAERVNEKDPPRGLAGLTDDSSALEERKSYLPGFLRARKYRAGPMLVAPQTSNHVARSNGSANGMVVRRPRVQGKFFFVGEEKLYVRGVTYGTFRPNEDGEEFPARDVVERDFAQMVANGVNAVRTYTPPPLWLLDAGQRHGLRIMAGLPVERSVALFDLREWGPSIWGMVSVAVT